MNKRLRGSIPAMITPLNEDGSLDEGSFRGLIKRALDSGCRGVMILGSCGEGVVVDRKTYEQAVETARDETLDKGILIVSTGAASVQTVKENIKTAGRHHADYVLNIPPMYFDETQEALKDYFVRLAEYSQLPTMIYNIPSVTKNNVGVQTLTDLSAHENIVGLKDSSGNHITFQRVVHETKENDFSVFVGRAPLICASLQMGAAGSMSPIPNLDPKLDLDIHRYLKEGKVQKAIDLQIRISKITGLFAYKNMSINVNLKGLLSALGFCRPYTAGFDPVLSENECMLLKEKYMEIIQ
ncbi:dihydrodipicolinate synthase family protein [Clostridium sp. chh4-2]|uniref:dihydrodipicolinate synthase family protein n=1 Tax=Clostridium sp. chh4-2 TaxID=2067550 RepID=UPI0015E1B2D2|nr:dihydrodipicolinate synthase family protein [Clostridium sp. chh4-2]